MQLTTENRRVRLFGLSLGWALVALLLIAHAVVFRDYVDLLDGIGLRGASQAPTPLKRICPTMYADAQMWVRHALALAHGAGPQLRYTYVDNAPFGREVHWNSGFAWLIAGAGELRHWWFGESLSRGVEQSMAWINAGVLLAIIIVFSRWVSRRAGLGAGLLVAFAMLGNPDFYSGFGPNYIDHHGLLAAAVLGLFLGAVFMGLGFQSGATNDSQLLPKDAARARSGAIFSAVCGAIGMWISAATLIPAIAIVGLAAAICLLLYGRGQQAIGGTLQPNVWRLWGRVGAWVSFAFYLLEYAPGHLGFRLEVNHPAYALGWWGGAEIIALIAEWRGQASAGAKFRPARLISAVIAISVAPAIIAIGGHRVFVVFDPFISRLSEHVAEGLSLFKTVQIFGWTRVWEELPWISVTVILAGLLWWRCRRLDRPLVLFCIISFVGSAAMAFAQSRWWPSVSGPEICLLLLAVGGLFSARLGWARWAMVVLLVLGLCLPPMLRRISLQRSVNRVHGIDAADALQPFYRDVAAALRQSQPEGEIVLLASPNASVAIGYYGQFKTIGTLYWENLAGTKAAAEMFSAQTETEARRLIRSRGVTHVAIISEDNFIAEYFGLLYPHPNGESLQKSFGYGLLVQQQVPIWLDPIQYEQASDLPRKVPRVLLFKTRFGPPEAEKAYEHALDEINAGRLDTGEKALGHALELDPKSAEFWLMQAHVLVGLGKPAPAAQAVLQSVNLAGPEQRAALCLSEANRFYKAGAPAEAALLYRRSLELNFDPVAANNLVWLMATSPDRQVRDGAAAVQLAERLVREHQDYIYISAYAAALAEADRFADAVKIETRAVELAQTAKDPSVLNKAKARLEAYRQGKPWRE